MLPPMKKVSKNSKMIFLNFGFTCILILYLFIEKNEMYSGMPTINRQLSVRDNNRLYPPPNAVIGTKTDVLGVLNASVQSSITNQKDSQVF